MNSPQKHDLEWEERIRRSVIQHYTDSAARTVYRAESWTEMQTKLKQRRLAEYRTYKLQSFGLAVASLLISIWIFALHPLIVKFCR